MHPAPDLNEGDGIGVYLLEPWLGLVHHKLSNDRFKGSIVSALVVN
jgi:hypothetical protein